MSYNTHKHGGQLQAASKKYAIPAEDWLDLSTGINSSIYPLPVIPPKCWQRLPETNDGLEQAATDYYGSKFLLPVSGSQEAIQYLPDLFLTKQRVGIIKPAYHSHHQAWLKAGHEIVELTTDEVDEKINTLDILIIVNPTNPSAETFSSAHLYNWHQQLRARKGTLIIDEAFIDATPESSLIKDQPEDGLIILRSIGKFFGLAGIRLGFVWANNDVLKQLASLQNDWSVSHPARWAGKIALQDNDWQQIQRNKLLTKSKRLEQLLEDLIFTKPCENGGVYYNTTNNHVQSTALFSFFRHPKAMIIYQQLAQQGILVRYFDLPALRFGLPAKESEWLRLEQALEALKL